MLKFDGKKLRHMRTAAEMAQTDVSSRLQIERSAIAAWELGKANPSVRNLTMLADVFGCSVNDFFTKEESA